MHQERPDHCGPTYHQHNHDPNDESHQQQLLESPLSEKVDQIVAGFPSHGDRDNAAGSTASSEHVDQPADRDQQERTTRNQNDPLLPREPSSGSGRRNRRSRIGSSFHHGKTGTESSESKINRSRRTGRLGLPGPPGPPSRQRRGSRTKRGHAPPSPGRGVVCSRSVGSGGPDLAAATRRHQMVDGLNLLFRELR